MNKEKEIQYYALCFILAIEDMVSNNDNENYIEVNNENATEVMTGLILGAALVFNKLTRGKVDYLEFTHVANRLVVQYLMKYGGLEAEPTVFNG